MRSAFSILTRRAGSRTDFRQDTHQSVLQFRHAMGSASEQNRLQLTYRVSHITRIAFALHPLQPHVQAGRARLALEGKLTGRQGSYPLRPLAPTPLATRPARGWRVPVQRCSARHRPRHAPAAPLRAPPARWRCRPLQSLARAGRHPHGRGGGCRAPRDRWGNPAPHAAENDPAALPATDRLPPVTADSASPSP